LRSYGIPAVALFVSLFGCSANPPDPGDDDDDGGSGGSGAMPTGGTGPTGGAAPMGGTGTGGSAPTGGSTGKGGTGGGLQIPGMPRPFPQGKATGTCQITNHPMAAQAVMAAYTYWKQQFLVAGNPGLRVTRPTNGGDTVSEGIAYGMLAAVYMVDKPSFDGLYTYAKAHFDSKGLMNWKITSAGATASDGAGSALDADFDMAWALIMASAQWQDVAYLVEARQLINAMATHCVGSDGMLLPGDNWGATDRTFPDYFSPAYMRVFATLTNNRNWTGAIMDKNYQILADVSGMYGLVPDSTTRTYVHMGAYGYDAVRTPWRITMDWCWNGEPRAKAYLDKIGAFFNSQLPVSNFGDGYSLTGQKTSNFGNMAFVGTAGVAGMAGWPNLLNEAFTYGATGTGGNTQYYQQSLRVMTMLMMSGNFLDYTKP
jgi:endo-1,4-beta-D-glucanase Y